MKNNWQTKKLGEISTISSGATPSRMKPDYYLGGTIPWVKSGELASGEVNRTEEFITHNAVDAARLKILPQGTPILAMYGATAGTAAILNIEGTTNQAVAAIQPDIDILDPKYTFYFLKFKKGEFLRKRLGGAQPNISQKTIKSMRIPVPPLSIQQQIVEKLDSIRRLQELNQKEIEKAEELFDSFFNSIFSLTNDWTIKKISDVTVINPPKPKFHEWDLEKEIDFLPMSALATDAQNPFPAEKRKLKQVIKGYTCFQSDDILLAKITPCFENGKTGIFRKNPKSVGFGSTEFIVLRADDKKVIPLWVWLFIFSKRFRQEGKLHMTGTAGQKRLPVSFVENYQIPIPSLNIQQQIIEKFQNIASLFELKKKEKEKLTELFKSTLSKLMRPN